MRSLLFIFILLTSLCVGAQEHQRLAGYIQIPGKAPTSYYLDIVITGTSVKGYSITDWQGGNRLKAAVVGRRAPASELSFEETSSLDSPRSRLAEMTYCYFSGRLKLTIMMNGTLRWSGPFESRQLNGAPCESGTMTLTNDAPILEPVPTPRPKPVVPAPPKPTPKPVTVVPPVVKSRDTAPVSKPVVKARDTTPAPKPVVAIVAPRKDPPKPVIILKSPARPAPVVADSCMRAYLWASDTLILDISDGWTTDGDVVSVVLNGETLFARAALSAQKQRREVILKKGRNILNVILHEAGIEPPNTPSLVLYDRLKKYELAISGETGETVRICIDH